MSSLTSKEIHNLTIIGGGMSGLTTAIFAAQEGLTPLVIMGDKSDAQLPLIPRVTNFPGHSDGITGQQLLDNITQQAQKFGALLKPGQVIAVDLTRRPFNLTLNSGENIFSRAIVIATGTYQKRLGLPAEISLRGKGVYDIAIKDAPLCKDKHIIVVGGGNSAMGEALEIAKYAREITVIYERTIYASATIRDHVIKTSKAKILENTVVTEIRGEERVTGVVLGNSQFLPADGIFVANGRPVNTALFKEKLQMDEEGVVKICSGTSGTSVQGIFAVGDMRRPLKYRKLSTAVGDGPAAAIDVKEYLASYP